MGGAAFREISGIFVCPASSYNSAGTPRTEDSKQTFTLKHHPPQTIIINSVSAETAGRVTFCRLNPNIAQSCTRCLESPFFDTKRQIHEIKKGNISASATSSEQSCMSKQRGQEYSSSSSLCITSDSVSDSVPGSTPYTCQGALSIARE